MRCPSPLALLLAAMPCAALAQAGCPTAADLAGGIEVTYDDGRREVFRATDRPEVVLMERTDADGRTDRVTLGRGLHWLAWEVVGGSRSTYDFGVPPEALPAPEPGGRWATEVSDGGAPMRLTYAYGEAAGVTVGACAYDAFETLVLWHRPEGGPLSMILTVRSRYIPALGVALEVELQLAEDAPESWVPTGIRSLK